MRQGYGEGEFWWTTLVEGGTARGMQLSSVPLVKKSRTDDTSHLCLPGFATYQSIQGSAGWLSTCEGLLYCRAVALWDVATRRRAYELASRDARSDVW